MKLSFALFVSIAFMASCAAQNSISCYQGTCLLAWTDGMCQYSEGFSTESTNAPDSHDVTQNPLVCAEVQFTCSDALPDSWKSDCTSAEQSSGVQKKGYRGMFQDDCNALTGNVSISAAKCCTEDECNAPSGNPDASNPKTLFCYQGFCRDDQSDSECLSSLGDIALAVADAEHDVSVNPLTCYSFYFVCTTRYEQGESSCTAAEAATAVVKRAFGFSYQQECQNLQSNGQTYIGATCCQVDQCNDPGSLLPFGAASSGPAPSSLVVVAALVLSWFAAARN